MDENKEWIYPAEPIALLSSSPSKEAPQSLPPSPPPPPAPRRRAVAGLMIGVAVFAMAFMLCDAVYTLRGTAAGHQTEEWLTQLLAGSFVGVSEQESSTSNRPVVEPRPEATASSESKKEHLDPAVSETAPAEPAPSLTPEMLYAYDASVVPTGMIPIVPMDLSLISYGETFCYNDTGYDLSKKMTSSDDVSVPTAASAGEVSVLILHTHATEGYSDEGALWYDPATPLARAEDPDTGVIAVGEAIAKYLNAKGIVTVHSTVLHDAESYKDSYSRSAQTVQSYLKQYPSIRLVIDVHRDSILSSKDQLIRPVTVVNGEAVAQVMCVVGSNAAGGSYNRWQDNFALALCLRDRLNGLYGNLSRPVYVKKSTYNQQYAPASLLLEIGSSGNTKEEALRAGLLVAEQIAQMMSE